MTQYLKFCRQLTKDYEFTMPSDNLFGSLLRTLVASKPNSYILELGTGTGLSLSWIVDGMDSNSKVISLDNDPNLINEVSSIFKDDDRITVHCADGANWINTYQGPLFDFIFADTWPGKYSDLEKTLDLVAIGGIYLIDDMTEQDNWPVGHDIEVNNLISYLDGRKDFAITKLNWSTGIIICTKTD